MIETVAVMSLHLAGHIPGPSPECPDSGLTGSWEAGPGHSCTFCHSQDQSLVGRWVRPSWCQLALPRTFPAVPPTQLSGGCFGDSAFPVLPEALLGFWSCLQSSSALLAQPEVQVWGGLVVCVGPGDWVGYSGRKHLSNECWGPREVFCFVLFCKWNFTLCHLSLLYTLSWQRLKSHLTYKGHCSWVMETEDQRMSEKVEVSSCLQQFLLLTPLQHPLSS